MKVKWQMANNDTKWYKPSDLTIAKQELNIADDKNDTLLNDYGIKANRKIDNLVFAVLDDIPTTIPAEITQDLKQAAILDIARRYKIKVKSFEAAKEYERDFDDIIESVRIRAKATPTDRTKTLLISSDPREKKTILPTQSSIFAFDNF